MVGENSPQRIPAPDVQVIDDDAPTERSFVIRTKRETKSHSKLEIQNTKRQRWWQSDVQIMLEAAKLLGKDYTRIAKIVNTKTRGQVAKQANDLFHKSGNGHATPDSEFIR